MHFEFGEFQLDSAARELRRGGEPVPVEPKVLELLARLVQQRGRVVSREVLERTLWPGVSVSPAALSRLVKEARRALGDDGSAQAWIETHRGRGFRFAVSARETAGSPIEASYVGRMPLLERLDAMLEGAFDGRGHLLLLSGEPGVGKTRTAEELAARARLLGARVATAWSSEADGAPAYWPWIQLLRSLAEHADAAALRERLGPSGDILARLVPELAPGPAPSGAGIGGAAERFRLFDGVRGFLARSARGAPLVLVLDDLHWSDAASIDLLDFLSHELPHTALVILATLREPELLAQPERAAAIASLRSRAGVESWPLRAFSRSEVRAMIEACGTRDPTPALVELLHTRSDGSPLFLGELLHVASREGLHGGEPEAWDALAPSGLERLLEARVLALSEETRWVISRAAAIGRAFEEAQLARVVDRSDAALDAALGEAAAARIVVPEPGRSGWRRFSHALLRDALYARLTAGARAETHARIASTLGPDRPGGDPELETLAHHCIEAIPVSGAERAVLACARAGAHALHIHAYERADRHLGRALELIEAGGGRDLRRRCELLLQRGEARRLLGDVTSSRSDFASASDLARELGDAVAVAQAALGFAGLYAYGPPESAVAERIERAAGDLGPEHEAWRARLLARLASELMLDPNRRRRATLRRRAWIAAGNGGDLEAIVEIAAHPDHGIWDTMVPPGERLELAERYERGCRERGARPFELAARVMVLDELLRRGRVDEYDARAPGVDRLAAAVREPRVLWARELQGFSRALVRGDHDAAERCAERARDFGQRHLDARAALALWGRQLAVLRAQQGRLGELREPWERAGAGAGTPSNRALHAWICAADGDRERAREIATPLWCRGAAALADEPMASANAVVLAEVCAFLEDPGPAEALLALLRPYAGMNALRTYAACHGPVDHYRGLLESLRGRSEAAARYLDAATALAERMEAPYFAARTRATLRALRAAPRRRA